MIIKRIKLIVIITICILSTEVLAQEKYKADLGILGGESFYLGDANKKLFNNMQVTFGGFLRYKINPRFAIKLELANTSIKGNFIGIDTTAYLNKSVNTGEIISEFNFFDFERNKNNRNAKILSPYIFAGLGGITGMYPSQIIPEICIPFGVGLKFKMAERINLQLQWSSKLMLNDNLEEKINPTKKTKLNNFGGLNGTNALNNDLLSSLTIGVSVDFWKKPCDCRNNSYTKRSNK